MTYKINRSSHNILPLRSHVFKIVLALILLLRVSFLHAQDNSEAQKQEEATPRHRVTIMMANSHIPNMEGVAGQNKFSVVPTWSFDYDFWFNSKWAIGLHNDLVLQQYKIIKEEDHTEVERSYPLGACIVGIYKPFKHLSFVTGAGKEFEKHESFGMWKLGLEYGFELPKAWELSLNFQYDNKWKAYDSWLFGLGISKRIR